MSGALVPTSFAELVQMSEVIIGARGLIPRDIATPAHAVALIMRGSEIGLGPMESLTKLHLIEGRVTLPAETMLALAIRGGVRHKFVDHTPELVTIELTRPGFEAFRCSWSIADAKRAGLAGRQNWRKFPRAMLRARVISEALRAYAPDLLGGAYVPGEVPQAGEPDPVIEAQIIEAPAPEPPQAAERAPEPPEEVIDARIVEEPARAPQEPPVESEGGAIGDREYLDILFGECLQAALASKTLADGTSGPAKQIRAWLRADHAQAMSDLHASAWALIMPTTIDEAQARRLTRRLATDDGKAGLRRQLYRKLGPIVEHMRESPQQLMEAR